MTGVESRCMWNRKLRIAGPTWMLRATRLKWPSVKLAVGEERKRGKVNGYPVLKQPEYHSNLALWVWKRTIFETRDRKEMSLAEFLRQNSAAWSSGSAHDVLIQPQPQDKFGWSSLLDSYYISQECDNIPLGLT